MAPLIPAGAGIGEDHPSKTWSFQTLCATIYDPDHLDQYGSSSTPIYQCTTFKGLPGTKKTAYDYSRSSNPSRSVLQNHLSKIQGAKYSFAVSTGMACLDIITRSVKPNEVILAGDDIYGGTHRLLGMLMKNNNIKVVHVDMSDQKLLTETVRQLVEDGKQPGAPKLGMVSTRTSSARSVISLVLTMTLLQLRSLSRRLRTLCSRSLTSALASNRSASTSQPKTRPSSWTTP